MTLAVIQRKAAQECVNMVIGDFRQFLRSSDNNKVERSKVHYLELIDENPDSDEAMLRVTEDLLDKFSTNSHQDWIVLVGDGKTYQHLMRIKYQYGEALQTVLLFPGNWHILKNFQEVLMKAYYSAGLKEIAMKSGSNTAFTRNR